MDEPVLTFDKVQQLEEALHESQALALAGQFAAATMHEVNGPLEAITNLNYLVQTNSDDGQQVRNYSGLSMNSSWFSQQFRVRRSVSTTRRKRWNPF